MHIFIFDRKDFQVHRKITFLQAFFGAILVLMCLKGKKIKALNVPAILFLNSSIVNVQGYISFKCMIQ